MHGGMIWTFSKGPKESEMFCASLATFHPISNNWDWGSSSSVEKLIEYLFVSIEYYYNTHQYLINTVKVPFSIWWEDSCVWGGGGGGWWGIPATADISASPSSCYFQLLLLKLHYRYMHILSYIILLPLREIYRPLPPLLLTTTNSTTSISSLLFIK